MGGKGEDHVPIVREIRQKMIVAKKNFLLQAGSAQRLAFPNLQCYSVFRKEELNARLNYTGLTY